MKIKLFLFAGILFMSSFSSAETPADKVCTPRPFKYPFEKVQPHPFQVGEKLVFSINYQFVKAGKATMEVLEGPIMNCRPTYQFISKAESASFVDAFFVVRDFNSSVADKESLVSFGYHQNLREGKFRVIRNTTLDYETAGYTYEKQYKGKNTKRQGPLEMPMHDVLSAFFMARTFPLELGQTYGVLVFSDGDYYQLKIKVAPKLEEVRVPAGKFECKRLDPELKSDGIFKMKDGKMQMWLTNDERHMPVLIRSKVALGAFDAELESFDSPQNDMVKKQVPTR